VHLLVQGEKRGGSEPLRKSSGNKGTGAPGFERGSRKGIEAAVSASGGRVVAPTDKCEGHLASEQSRRSWVHARLPNVSCQTTFRKADYDRWGAFIS